MKGASNLTAEVADWALGLRYEDVPSDVIDLAKLQMMSVLGASEAGRRSSAGQKVEAAARHWTPYGEAFTRLSWSMAHDFDDYLFAGHTGHSAVWLSLLEGSQASGKELLTAQVAGNEVGGRLGAALLLGPHNGQMWAYIHTLIACCVAGRLRRLDEAALHNAIGIAFAMPHYPLMPGFMGPESKLLTAAFPALQGLMAVDLAQQGLSGASDILGGRDGFLKTIGRFARASAFAGLGRVWLTRTLCIKLYPGCAYIDTAADALGSLDLKATEVEHIEVVASPFTLGMERLSHRHRRRDVPEPVSINFSVPLSLALQLLEGEITPDALEPAAIEKRWPEMHQLARRNSPRLVFTAGRSLMRRAARLLSMENLDTTSFRMAFPAEVRVELKNGEVMTARCDVPAGAAGRPREETARLVREKLSRCLEDGAPALLDRIDRIESLRGADILEKVRVGAPGRS
jgi:2-methylcitrate dehydratase PrpD